MSAILKLFTPSEANEKTRASTAMPARATTAKGDLATPSLPRQRKASKAKPKAVQPQPQEPEPGTPVDLATLKKLMPRGVWYRASNQTWYSESLHYKPILGKRQIKLVEGLENWKQAIDAHEAVQLKLKQRSIGDDIRIDALADQYLEVFEKRWQRGQITVQTFTGKQWSLRLFCSKFGRLTVKEFSDNGKEPVYDWLHDQRAVLKKQKAFLSSSTKRKVIKHLLALFNWAHNEHKITHNPLKGIVLPAECPRSAVYTFEQEKAILALFKGRPRTHEFLRAMAHLGCRPFIELAKVKGEFIEWSGGEPGKGIPMAWHFPGKIKGRKRSVCLDPAMSELTHELWKKHKGGILFRREDGKPFTATLQARFGRMVRKLAKEKPSLGLKKEHGVLYTFRHTVIVRMLRQPGSDVQWIADQMGNSVKVISEFYAKYNISRPGTMQRLAALREQTD